MEADAIDRDIASVQRNGEYQEDGANTEGNQDDQDRRESPAHEIQKTEGTGRLPGNRGTDGLVGEAGLLGNCIHAEAASDQEGRECEADYRAEECNLSIIFEIGGIQVFESGESENRCECRKTQQQEIYSPAVGIGNGMTVQSLRGQRSGKQEKSEGDEEMQEDVFLFSYSIDQEQTGEPGESQQWNSGPAFEKAKVRARGLGRCVGIWRLSVSGLWSLWLLVRLGLGWSFR